MSAIRMQALKRYRHNGNLLHTGDIFEVLTPGEADDLVAVGFARRATVAAIEQPMTPASPSAQADPGAYARRDMRPKG